MVDLAELKGERKVEALRATLTHGGQALADIPRLVLDVLTQELWRNRPSSYRAGAKLVRFTEWTDFVRAEPPAGLGQDPVYLAKLCEGHTDVEAALAKVSPAQGKHHHNNIMVIQGTGRAYALRRLERQRPDLLADVVAKRISPHAAMVKAGFRRPAPTLESTLRRLIKAHGFDAVRRVLDQLGAIAESP